MVVCSCELCVQVMWLCVAVSCVIISSETSRYDRPTAVSSVYGSHNSSVAICCTVVLQHVSTEMESSVMRLTRRQSKMLYTAP